MHEILKLAAPAGIHLEVFSIPEAIETLRQTTIPKNTTMLLLKSPDTARRLYEGGLTYKTLTIGGLGMGATRKPIFKNIALSKIELKILKDLSIQGVKIILQRVPGEKPQSLWDIAK